ncbi:hypothetical protein [Xanthomonas sacchari]|uniref:hypothetical protein n=1 Tax=Xanthomonas sacchari TaxID=56458 RepID=UPI003526CFAB
MSDAPHCAVARVDCQIGNTPLLSTALRTAGRFCKASRSHPCHAARIRLQRLLSRRIMWFLAIPALILLWIVIQARQPPLEVRLHQALQQARQGDLRRLRALSRASVGDAAYALFLQLDAQGEQAAALAALKHAVHARTWLDICGCSVALREYGCRRFLGVGATPDHAALLAEWSRPGWCSGAGWEPELAWIQACGPQACRDEARAWYWLCLADARKQEGMGEIRSVELAQQVRAHLTPLLPAPVRQAMQEQAARTARDDYLSGR